MSVIEHPVFEHLGWTLVHFLWQGALIAILYALARKCVTDSRNAQLRYALGCVALAAMSVAPVGRLGMRYSFGEKN